MLDITRLQAGKLRLEKEPLDLSALVREVIQRFERQIMASGSSIRIEAPEPVQGRWDRYRIEQVFTNLLTNAVKYGAGNPISVAVWGTTEGGHLRVSDGGIGIAAEDQLRIFRQFERATGEDSGTTGLGLGLYIVRQIVESHGGKITVQSESGRGSSFTVELPYE
jgi:signal transduction histidine kinase